MEPEVSCCSAPLVTTPSDPPRYNDEGVTAAFNRNLLRNVNSSPGELRSVKFDHHAP